MEYKITKSETITVKEVGHNDYNDLTFKDTTGKDYKISVKRKSHFENLIIVGATLKINWSEAYNKPFIYTVEKLDQQNAPQPIPDAPQSKSTPIKPPTSHLVQAAEKLGAVPLTKEEQEKEYWDKKNKITQKSIERQKALEMAVSLSNAQPKNDNIIEWAKRFEKYLETGE